MGRPVSRVLGAGADRASPAGSRRGPDGGPCHVHERRRRRGSLPGQLRDFPGRPVQRAVEPDLGRLHSVRPAGSSLCPHLGDRPVGERRAVRAGLHRLHGSHRRQRSRGAHRPGHRGRRLSHHPRRCRAATASKRRRHRDVRRAGADLPEQRTHRRPLCVLRARPAGLHRCHRGHRRVHRCGRLHDLGARPSGSAQTVGSLALIASARYPDWKGHLYGYDVSVDCQKQANPADAEYDPNYPWTCDLNVPCGGSVVVGGVTKQSNCRWDAGVTLSQGADGLYNTTADNNAGVPRKVYTWNPASSNALVPITSTAAAHAGHAVWELRHHRRHGGLHPREHRRSGEPRTATLGAGRRQQLDAGHHRSHRGVEAEQLPAQTALRGGLRGAAQPGLARLLGRDAARLRRERRGGDPRAPPARPVAQAGGSCTTATSRGSTTPRATTSSSPDRALCPAATCSGWQARRVSATYGPPTARTGPARTPGATRRCSSCPRAPVVPACTPST